MKYDGYAGDEIPDDEQSCEKPHVAHGRFQKGNNARYTCNDYKRAFQRAVSEEQVKKMFDAMLEQALNEGCRATQKLIAQYCLGTPTQSISMTIDKKATANLDGVSTEDLAKMLKNIHDKPAT